MVATLFAPFSLLSPLNPRNHQKSPFSSKNRAILSIDDSCKFIDDSCIYWRKQKSSINLRKNVWGEFPALLPLWKTKKQIMMKTTTTYSPMTACRNPKVSARNVAEYLVVPNIILPTNLYIYYILNLISSDGEICRQGASLAMRPAVSCLYTIKW